MENAVGQPQTVQVPNYSGVNIQIFNPSVAAPGATVPPANVNSTTYSTNPCYPANYYTQNYAQPAQTQTLQPVQAIQPTQYVQSAQAPSGKKMETREIVDLTDGYVKNLENYLNSQDKELRLVGAKAVLARCQEDRDRKDDPALNALVNKMLQDPSHAIKFIAMGILESGDLKGNEETIPIIQKIQQTKTNDGQDEIKASNVLLKMSATTSKKDFEVNENAKKKSEK